jgi:hypothetical protein
MINDFIRWAVLLLFPAIVCSQDSDYLLHIQAYYRPAANQPYQLAYNYYGNFDREPAAIVLEGLPLSSAPRQIRLQLSLYSRRGLFAPDEVIINGQTVSDPRNPSYIINNPANWPIDKPLKISLFSNRPPLDHWIDIPLIWDGQSPATPPAPSGAGELTAKGVGAATVGPGHAIQAATTNKPPTARELEPFQRFGPVYYVHEPPFYKIRVGPFSSKQDALSQLVDVRHYENGAYADAFYLYEDKARTAEKYMPDIAQTPTGYETGAYTGVKGLPGSTEPAPQSYDSFQETAGQAPPATTGVTIQLSVHVAPPDVREYSYLSDLGQVYVQKDRNIYKLKIGPFRDRKAAEAAMPQIEAAGFTGAFIERL